MSRSHLTSLFCLSFLFGCRSGASPAEVVIRNGTIYTANQRIAGAGKARGPDGVLKGHHDRAGNGNPQSRHGHDDCEWRSGLREEDAIAKGIPLLREEGSGDWPFFRICEQWCPHDVSNFGTSLCERSYTRNVTLNSPPRLGGVAAVSINAAKPP